VPVLARHVPGALVGVDDQDLGMARDQAGGGGVHRQLTEEAAEGLLLLGGHVLIAEEDHLVLDEGVVDLLERGLLERPGQVHAEHLGADMGCELLDGQGLVTHGQLLSSRVGSGVAGSPSASATAGCTTRPRQILTPFASGALSRTAAARPLPASSST
jgi:hypothetical protein